MNKINSPVNKRWKLALIGSIFNIFMAAALFVIGQYQYLPVPIGCLGLIITTYVGGDSFRPSMYDTYNYSNLGKGSNINNTNEIVGE